MDQLIWGLALRHSLRRLQVFGHWARVGVVRAGRVYADEGYPCKLVEGFISVAYCSVAPTESCTSLVESLLNPQESKAVSDACFPRREADSAVADDMYSS